MTRTSHVLLALALSVACDSAPEEAALATPAPAPESPPAPEPEPATAPADAKEACARVVAVAYADAPEPIPGMTRTQEDARRRIDELRERVKSGEGMGAVARDASDSRRTAARDGLIGTYARGEFPPLFGMVEEPVFQIPIGALTEVLEAPFGYVFAERCAVEKVHVRHLLIRYAGADGADDSVSRTRDEARARAEALRQEALAPDADFPALARAHGEDGSAERGGDLQPQGRGLFEPPFEEAAFALAPGALSGVVETRFGFHLIRREPG